MISSAAGIVTLISIVGGGALFLGQPPYANRAEMEEQIAAVAVQYQQQKQESNDRLIYELEREKAKKGKLSEFEQREYDRLKKLRKTTEEQIQQLLKEKK